VKETLLSDSPIIQEKCHSSYDEDESEEGKGKVACRTAVGWPLASLWLQVGLGSEEKIDTESFRFSRSCMSISRSTNLCHCATLPVILVTWSKQLSYSDIQDEWNAKFETNG